MTGSPEGVETGIPHELRRAEIVDTALRLLNEVGLEKLSVRGIAQELAMHPPGLYWYIESKQDLIDRMAAAIFTEAYQRLQPFHPGDSWSDWLTALAVQLRQSLLQHRDGARVIASAYVFRTEAITPWIEIMLEVLEGVGFSRDQALGSGMALLHYATSITLDEQLSPPKPRERSGLRTTPQAGSEHIPAIGPVIDATRWPRAADAVHTLFRTHFRDIASFRERHFLLGLHLIIAGMREQLTRSL